MKLTVNDKKTLSLLLEDGRTTDATISESLGITKQAVGRIRKKLEKTGIIRRYTVELDYERLGIHVFAIVLASLTDEWRKMGELEATEALGSDPNLIKAFRVSRGEITHILVYAFKNQEELGAHFQKKDTLLTIKQIHVGTHVGMSKDENKELFKKVLGDSTASVPSQDIRSAIDRFKDSLKPN